MYLHETCKMLAMYIHRVSKIKLIISIIFLLIYDCMNTCTLSYFIIIKSQVWTICHCLILSRATMSCVICFAGYALSIGTCFIPMEGMSLGNWITTICYLVDQWQHEWKTMFYQGYVNTSCRYDTNVHSTCIYGYEYDIQASGNSQY